MESVGKRLRAERENRGVRRVEVSKATKVAAHHLAAIEFDNFEDLPEPVRVQGYVKAYAEYLDLDPDPILTQLADEIRQRRTERGEDAQGDAEARASRPPEASASPARTSRRAAVAASIVALSALAMLVLWLSSGGEEDPLGVPPPDPPVRIVEAPGLVTDGPVSRPGETRASSSTEGLAAPQDAEDAEAAAPPSEDPALPERSGDRPVEPRDESPAPAEAGSDRADTPSPALRVSRAAVGRDVSGRELVGEATRFPEGTRVWFWNLVEGGRDGDRIRHVWFHEGRGMGSVTLAIGGSRWRTYSRKTLWPGSAGSWTVEARDADGRVLARRSFVCTK